MSQNKSQTTVDRMLSAIAILIALILCFILLAIGIFSLPIALAIAALCILCLILWHVLIKPIWKVAVFYAKKVLGQRVRPYFLEMLENFFYASDVTWFLWLVSRKSSKREIYDCFKSKPYSTSRSLSLGIAEWEAKLPEYSVQVRKLIASDMQTLGDLLCDNPHGDKGYSLIAAIVSYKIASLLFTEEEFPNTWASIQAKLGTAYSQYSYEKKYFRTVRSLDKKSSFWTVRSFS